MVGLGLNPSKVSPDNNLRRTSKGGWMGISGCKGPRQLDPERFLKDLPLCIWHPKDVAEGSRSQPQPDAEVQHKMETGSLHTHGLGGTSAPHFPTTLAVVTPGILR